MKHKVKVTIIWWVYIALLFILVVVKFKASFYELSDRIHSYSEHGSINYNLIPFGFLLPVTYRKFNSAIKIMAIGLSSILFIELFQFFTKLGSFDVDDIILNMIGIICGYFIFLLINRVFMKEQ